MRTRPLPAIALLLIAACTQDEEVQIGTQRAGEACTFTSDCIVGYVCRSDVCVALDPLDADGQAGSDCTTDAQCDPGLCCGNQGACREELAEFSAGACGIDAGGPCGFSADCDLGLVCAGSGVCASEGEAGTGAKGEACTVIEDCRRPLLCGPGGTCEPVPFFGGVSCIQSEEELGGFRMYFEVPRAQPLSEFYRLPFPSDVRSSSGRLDLSGHPSPGEVLGIDFTAAYVGALEEDADGFGLSPVIFMRFSDELDTSTLGVNTATSNLTLVDITEGSPDYGVPIELQWTYTKERSLFICGNTLALAPLDGRPLRPRTTYAVVIGRLIESARGKLPLRDPDFAAMVAPTAPEDATLADAYASFAPLRAFLLKEDLPQSQVAGATVFTTGDPGGLAPKLRAAVRAAPAPALTELANCDLGETSPCDLPAQNRGCLADEPAFFQLQAKLTNPVWQRGTRPYPIAGPGGIEGAIEVGSDGLPIQQGTESLCIAITVPKGTPPAGGWPVVIFGHGTGGNYLSGVQSFAAKLADIQGDNGPLAKLATISFDNVMHGPRQGTPPVLWQDPGPLFFNIQNPRAARDNVLQGAADIMNLVRFAEAVDLPAAETGLPNALRFDSDRILYYGHSQGTVIAPAALAHEPGLRAAVFTGAGAELGLSLLEKKKPNDISALIRTAFGDQGVTRLHPIIGLLTWFFGPSDALPYARLIADEPPSGRGPIDFLHIYGLFDGYTPESAQQALVRAADAPVVGTVLRPVSGAATLPDVVQGNLGGATVGVLQFEPTESAGVLDYDGHFVGRNDPLAESAILRFLGTADDTPALIRRRANP